jgi:hypothetical protein
MGISAFPFAVRLYSMCKGFCLMTTFYDNPDFYEKV